MISHANGSAEWHREQRGIKTPEQQRIEQLEKELAECKRDAERYKLIKSNVLDIEGDGDYITITTHDRQIRCRNEAEFDTVIDSAIAAQNHCVETNNMVKGEGK